MFVLFSYSTRQLSFTITIVLFSTYSAILDGWSFYIPIRGNCTTILNNKRSIFSSFHPFFFLSFSRHPFFFSSQARAFSFSFELALTFFISLFLRTYKKFSYFIYFFIYYLFIDLSIFFFLAIIYIAPQLQQNCPSWDAELKIFVSTIE